MGREFHHGQVGNPTSIDSDVDVTYVTNFVNYLLFLCGGKKNPAPSARQVWSSVRAVVEGSRKRSVHFTPTQFDLPDRFVVLLSDAQSTEPLRQQNRKNIGSGHARVSPSVDAR